MTAPPDMFARTPGRSARLTSPAAPSSLLPSSAAPRGVIANPATLQSVAWELDALADRIGAPSTSRPAWLLPGFEPTKTARPWAVLLRDPDDVLRAAVGAVDWSDGQAQAGGGSDPVLRSVNEVHRAALLAESDELARQLGQAVDAELRGRTGPVRVAFGPLPADSSATAAFADGFQAATLVEASPIPAIRRDSGTNVDDYLTSSLRRTLRKARNRIESDGRRLVTTFERRPAQVAEMLPAVEFAHRERDHARGLPSELDQAPTTARWRRRMRGLGDAGRLEIGLAYLDGQLAAHVVGIIDGSTYRVLEGHLVTRWSRYAPGRLLEAEVVQRMLDEPSLTSLDWMTSVAPEALLAMNTAEPVVTIRVGTGTGWGE